MTPDHDNCGLRRLADKELNCEKRVLLRCADTLRPRSRQGRVDKAHLQQSIGWSMDWSGSPNRKEAPPGLRLGCPTCAHILNVRFNGGTSAAEWAEYRDMITGAYE